MEPSRHQLTFLCSYFNRSKLGFSCCPMNFFAQKYRTSSKACRVQSCNKIFFFRPIFFLNAFFKTASQASTIPGNGASSDFFVSPVGPELRKSEIKFRTEIENLQNCKKWNDFRVGVSYFWSLEKVCVRVGVRERHYLCE